MYKWLSSPFEETKDKKKYEQNPTPPTELDVNDTEHWNRSGEQSFFIRNDNDNDNNNND